MAELIAAEAYAVKSASTRHVALLNILVCWILNCLRFDLKLVNQVGKFLLYFEENSVAT